MRQASRRIRVMVIDDSAVVRRVMREDLQRAPDIEVIGAAADPLFALQHMGRDWPDVITLDIEMPRMDGLTFLRKIMSERPTPVIICSSLAERGARVTMEALSAGAVAIVTKPKSGVRDFLQSAADDLVAAVRAASHARMQNVRPAHAAPARDLMAGALRAAHAARDTGLGATTERVVAIGTSTGGTQALETVLTALPATCPGIVIVQHMPERFTALFAQRLDGLCEVQVREARDGDRVLPGTALIAPGARHMVLRRSGAQYTVEVSDGPVVNHHKPSVDVLFRSVARVAGNNALGIVMTGMGSDGALGMQEMRRAGTRTIAQDEETCVVYGMPKEAVKLGAVDRVLPLQSIAGEILAFA